MRLLFLGRLQDVAGGAERQVATATSLRSLIAALEPALAEAVTSPRIRVAVNGTVVAGDAPLAESDEVAFLPPVSGG
ncbi:MAG: MoaD/ThiS family protein [Novosphingobium sp.]